MAERVCDLEGDRVRLTLRELKNRESTQVLPSLPANDGLCVDQPCSYIAVSSATSC